VGAPLAERLARAIARRGPVPFADVVDAALYDPEHGFYATGGAAGRRGDFITSPEVGPLFGAVIARALDRWWREVGEPDPFVVIEAGAGTGTLARSVVAAEPACADALRYVLVERSARLRAQHAVSLETLPRVEGPVVVLANELLDNLAFGLAERVERGWAEVHVGISGGEFVEALAPAHERTAATLDRLAPEAAVGSRVPVERAACEWLHDALLLAGSGGRVVVIDYASTTAAMASRPWREWVRTYRAHQPGGLPLAGLGEQDITVEVAVDQLALVRPPDSDRSQADFLRDHGIDDLVAEGRRNWEARAAVGDLEALRARSRVTEAEALLDPAGLGAFRVLEWTG
jgi:SAM-dependent MidA family methyltransferase